jgi:DHHC palmitoyltransferase
MPFELSRFVAATGFVGLVHVACFPSEVARPLGLALAERTVEHTETGEEWADAAADLDREAEVHAAAELIAGTLVLGWACLGVLFTASYFQSMLSHPGRVRREGGKVTNDKPKGKARTKAAMVKSSNGPRKRRQAQQQQRASVTCATESPSSQEKEGERRLCPYCGRAKPAEQLVRHCAVCDRCVGYRDHHCLWTNNCVGRDNHRAFLRTVVLVVLGCLFMLLSIVAVWILCPPALPDLRSEPVAGPFVVLALYTFLVGAQFSLTGIMLWRHIHSDVLAAIPKN